MKTGLKVTAVLATVFVAMLIMNQALRLLNERSDMAVLAGFGIILVCVVAAVTAGAWARKRILASIQKQLDAHKGEAPRAIALAFLVLAMVSTTGCYKLITPGHVGVVVHQTGSDRGVQDFPLQVGRVWYNPVTETVFEYPTNVQRVIWTKSAQEGKAENEEINYNSKDELVFHGDFAVSYELLREHVPAFYVKFRNDDIEAFTHGFFRDEVRNALNDIAAQYTADELYGEKKSEFLDKAKERIIDRVKAFGVNVVALGYASSPRPPEQVANAINNKIAAIQLATQKENELRQSEADAKKVIAAARGTAEANAEITKSINPQLIQWRQLDVQQQAIYKWNGQLPAYTGGGAVPFIQLGK